VLSSKPWRLPWALRVAELVEHLGGAHRERIGRFLEPERSGEEDAIGQREERGQPDQHDQEAEHRDRGPRNPFDVRRRDHLGRRNLARGERRGERVAPGERGRDGQDRSRAPSGVLLQATLDHPLDDRVHVGHDGRRAAGTGRAAQLAQLLEARCVERALAREQLVEHEAERIDVAARGDLDSLELLGRHVVRRAGADLGAGDIRGQRGEAEIRDAHLPRAVDHDVRRLEVAVQDPLGVRGGEAGTDLSRDLDRLLLRRTTDAPDQRGQVLAVHVLHRQETLPAGFPHVVDATDAGVRDLTREPHLVEEARQAVLAALDSRGQELQRNGLAQRQVVGPVHLAHPAAAEQTDDAPAARQHGARREPSVLDPARSRRAAQRTGWSPRAQGDGRGRRRGR